MTFNLEERRMRSPEEYFKFGVDAMQGRIVAWLVMKGHMDIAPKILGIEPPPFSEPEVWGVKSKEESKIDP